MGLSAYRELMRLPRVPVAYLLAFFGRLPMTLIGLLTTLYLVSELDRGYGEAGLVGSMMTVGMAIGQPFMGRLVDRFGVRRVVACTGAVPVVYWLALPELPYSGLIVLAPLAGATWMPINGLARQFVVALVPPDRRRTAFSLDSVLTELAFVLGPVVAVGSTKLIGFDWTMRAVAVWLAVVAVGLWTCNLPVRSADEVQPAGRRPRLRTWMRGDIVGAYLVTAGALFTLVGCELAVIAANRQHGEDAYTGVVIAVMATASLIGGLVYGSRDATMTQAQLAFWLGLLLMPVALVTSPWWVLAIATIPMNAFCAPTLAAGSETVARLAPARVRGEAMGLMATAISLGLALGNPVVGTVIDLTSPGWGFVVAGLGGVLTAVAAAGLAWRSARRQGMGDPSLAAAETGGRS